MSYTYDCDININECKIVRRVVDTLNYYETLDVPQNLENNEDNINPYLAKQYVPLIDDYAHLIEYHGNEIQQIKHNLNHCGLNECQYLYRHYSNTYKLNSENTKLVFYYSTMDSIHCYSQHLYDIGLRTMESNDKEQNAHDFKDENSNSKYFDREFARKFKIVSESKKITDSFDRFKNNTKYTINVNVSKTKTFTDGLIDFVTSQNRNPYAGLKFLAQEEYDTDAVLYEHNYSYGNMDVFDISLGQFVQQINIASSTFGMGCRLYYWKYYETGDEKGQSWVTDHCHGVTAATFCVHKKYDSLKEEILIHLPKQLYDLASTKVNEYMRSDRVKKMKANNASLDDFIYGFNEGDEISWSHLMVIVFYTDHSDESREFSASLRRKDQFEPLDSVKSRNSEYFFTTKYLREAVEIFGNNSYSGLSGPFYTGVSRVLKMPEFSIRFCAPTSTSKQIEVALRFGGSDGMILKLHNPEEWQYAHAMAFNCSFISKYKSEDERLFCGGFYPMLIQTVKIIATKSNYEDFIYSFYILEAMITAQKVKLIAKKKHKNIIDRAMRIALDEIEDHGFDTYAVETFLAFRLRKTQIILDLFRLSTMSSKVTTLIMESIENRKASTEKKRSQEDITNLFKARLLKVFTHVNTIIIYTTHFRYKGGDMNSYSFSLIKLLKIIHDCGVSKVVIKSDTYDDISWIREIWVSDAKVLTNEFSSKNYSIYDEHVEDDYDKRKKEFWLVIEKRLM